MELPYCKICGEKHRLGFCPEFGYAPPKAAFIPAKPSVPANPSQPVRKPVDVKPAVQRQPAPLRIEAFPLPHAGRAFTPDDMKQESLSKRQQFKKMLHPTWDKKKYFRETMRKRRAEGRA